MITTEEAIANLAPLLGNPATIEAEYRYEVMNAIEGHPRSKQREIGPSEIGIPCTRTLLHKLNHDEEPSRGIPWLATIGTAMHAWLADAFDHSAFQTYPNEPPRYLIEQRIMVGQIAGRNIWGSCDLFDTHPGAVIDHKLVGPSPLQEYKRNGPRAQYRTQAHLYGRGMQLLGHDVRWVMLAFLPRNSPSLSDAYFWSEPYDESVAIAALERASSLAALLTAIGIDAALALYPPCSDTRNCPYCRSTSTAVRPPTTSARELFAGSL